MAPSRLLLLVIVIATAVVSLAALFGHLFLGGEVKYPAVLAVGLVCGIAGAVYLKRSDQSDSHN
jgi:hypothetical protein